MKKRFEAAFLLAGTAIGSGMISLPMVLAKFGIINTCAIIIFFAILTYLTALVRSDLNLNLYAEATLKDVGKAFDCYWAGIFGNFLLVLLHFALMAAYLFGFSSILCSFFGNIVSQYIVMALSAIGVALGFLFASHFIININKYLFILMFFIFIVLVIELFFETQIHFIPRCAEKIKINEWTTLVPIIFTSFGFQGSIHSMTKFCNNDRKMIKMACLWGSIVPALVYIIWTVAILLVVANTDAHFFQLMLDGKANDVGELVTVLSNAASSQSVQIIVWIVSILAILTSVLGVGSALMDIFQQEWQETSKRKIVGLVVFAPAAVSMLVPNTFIRILNVSGVILSLIAIVVPVIISLKMQRLGKAKKCELLLKNKFAIFGVFTCGVMIIFLGILDLVKG